MGTKRSEKSVDLNVDEVARLYILAEGIAGEHPYGSIVGYRISSGRSAQKRSPGEMRGMLPK